MENIDFHIVRHVIVLINSQLNRNIAGNFIIGSVRQHISETYECENKKMEKCRTARMLRALFNSFQ